MAKATTMDLAMGVPLIREYHEDEWDHQLCLCVAGDHDHRDEPAHDEPNYAEKEVTDLNPIGDVEMTDAKDRVSQQRAGKLRKIQHGILVDSGAGASCADGDQFPEFAREESAGSKRGQHFVSAAKERIPNRGQKMISFQTKTGIRSRVNLQDVKVRRPILAVSDSTKVGNLLCFDEEESVIMPRNCEEGKKIR